MTRPSVSKPANGQIITFYSYKGGTGRSMALANVAWVLASAGKRVLTLDWDLEAPGLHRYFYPFLVDKDLTSSEGIIDFVLRFATAAIESKDQSSTEVADKEWYKPYTNILRYASSLNWKFDPPGTLDFVPAGRQGSSYSTRVNSFNWQNFYDLLGGGTMLELAKEKMRSEYDYILIDSRTGVSDTSGICTVQMPDILVICFTLNNQSIEGATAVANAVFEQRSKSNSSIKIFPVAMRIENAEKLKLQKRKDYAKEKLKLFPNGLPGEGRDKYWGDTPVIYVPYYAYEEILAAFGDNSEDRISVLAAAEQLTNYLTEGKVKKLVPPPEAGRKKVLAVYEGGPLDVSAGDEQNRFAESIFDGLTTDDKEKVRRVFTRLVRVAQPNEVGGDTLLRLRSRDMEQSVFSILRPLIDARLLELEQDGSTGNYMVKIANDTLLQDWKRLRTWINDDREFLLWRQRLQTRFEEWEKVNRDTAALLTGTLLEEAVKWQSERATELSANEAFFINTSVEEADNKLRTGEAAEKSRLARNKKLIRRAAAVVLGVLVLLGLYKGYDYLKQRRLDELRDIHAKAEPFNNAGLRFLDTGDLHNAEDSFNTAIGIDPSFTDAYMNRGNAYRRSGQLDRAIADFNKAIQMSPYYPNPSYYLGLTYRDKSQFDKAIASFQRCVSLSGDEYWILSCTQSLQLVRDGLDIAIFAPNTSSAEEIKKVVEVARYRAATGITPPVDNSVVIRYGIDNDQGYALDLKEMITDYLFLRHNGIQVRTEKAMITEGVRIGIFLPDFQEFEKKRLAQPVQTPPQ